MTTYKYTGVTSTGQVIKNTIEAESLEQATAMVASMGLRIENIEERKMFSMFQPKIKKKDLAIALRQIQTMIKASIPIPVILNVMYEDAKKGYQKEVWGSIYDSVLNGHPLSEAMAEFPNVFNEFILNMVEVGETNGRLDIAFDRVATTLEKNVKLAGKVKGAMIYPAVLMVVAIFMVIFLSVSIVPTFAELFTSFGSELPTVTKIMMAISDFLIHFWWLCIIIAIGLAILCTYLWRQEKSKRVITKVALVIPVIGKLMIANAMAKFSRTMASMLDGGVSIIRALSITQGSVGNIVYSDCFEYIINNVKEGKPIWESLQATERFTNLTVSMTKIGEDSGKLGDLLTNTAELYEDEIERKTAAAMSLMEPLITIVIGGIVLFVVLSIVVPMFQMYSLVGT